MLREIMSARREEVLVKGSFGEWFPITIHLDGRISVRDRASPYKGAMFAAYPGDIVFSKIDARSGAIGVLPADIPKAVVTSEFPVFIPEPDKLDGRFLQLVLRTGGFLKALSAKASGTSGRKRITPEAFLELRIPLPSLDDQTRIVAAYDAAFANAAVKENEAVAVEEKAAIEFEATLGFAPVAPLPDRRVFIASFRHLDRWSREGILRAVLKTADPVLPFPITPLGDVGKVSYGLQKYPGNRPGLHARPYLRVANVQRDQLDLTVIKTIEVPDREMPKYRLEICRAAAMSFELLSSAKSQRPSK
jgi:type I restriction enzyme S subunit